MTQCNCFYVASISSFMFSVITQLKSACKSEIKLLSHDELKIHTFTTRRLYYGQQSFECGKTYSVSARVYVCVCVHVCVCMCAWVDTCMRAYVCVCVCVPTVFLKKKTFMNFTSV